MVRAAIIEDFIADAANDICQTLEKTGVAAKLIELCYPERSVEQMITDIVPGLVETAKDKGWLSDKMKKESPKEQRRFWRFYDKALREALVKLLNDELKKKKTKGKKL